jgi:hypothetical protein
VRPAQLWEDGNWVFASPTGGPLNPNTDYRQWHRAGGLLWAPEEDDGEAN